MTTPDPPWWFCNGWWSPWCVLDEVAHRLLRWDMEGDHWLCRKHDTAAQLHLKARS